MSRLLLPSSPLYGHVLPLVSVGSGLARLGHDVTVLTGTKYRRLVEDAGLRFRPLSGAADYDDSRLESVIGEGARSRNPLARARATIRALFVAHLREQYECLERELRGRRGYDAVVADTAYLGTVPLTMRASADRPVVFGISVTPLSLRSADTAHFGSALRPDGITYHRHRNAQIDWLLTRGPLRPVQRDLDRQLAPFGGSPGDLNYFDVAATHDETFHLGPREFEYPRREMPDSIRFVGPLHYPGEAEPESAPWWHEFIGDRRGRPVVHITQGTLDTADFTKLLVPAIQGLADADVLVVASTGRRPISTVTRHFTDGLPRNTRIAEFLPYDTLLPRCDAVVTNGGYGGVLRSLSHGVPLVVAGAGEDKPEVAARVAWSGCGLDARSGRPSPRRLRRLVSRVLTDPRYRQNAAHMSDRIAELGDPITSIHASVRLVDGQP